jgi:cation transporter-like permease
VTPERPALAERIMRFALLLLLSFMVAGVSTWALGATWEAIGGGEMSVHGWIALALGILGTSGLAWGLMALAFLSHREGWDDRVNNSLDPGRPPDHDR